MVQTIKIALDAMGGDIGPEAVIPAAQMVAKNTPDLHFLIYGDEARILPLLAKHRNLRGISTVIHTDKFVPNDEKPSTALRNGKGSSMRLAIEAVKEGKADAVVSAGNTGALMAIAKIVLKTLPGIHRPAIASVFPGLKGQTIMLDLGANVLVDAENLAQFAVLGAVFAKAQKKIAVPSVGLLNVGTEDTKGPDHVKGAAHILANVDFPGHYRGFVEGTDIMSGEVDVIVSDGYAGNIALKAIEGAGQMISTSFKNSLRSDPLAIVGSFLSVFALKRFKTKVDPRLYNGGVFLGLNGICVKSHGGSDALGISSAIRLACNLAREGYIKTVSEDIGHLMSQETLLTEGPIAIKAMTRRAVIQATGSFLPEKILTNQDMESIVDTTAEWIEQRSGIKQRHIGSDNETTADLAIAAAKDALTSGGIDPASIDCVIVATTTPDQTFPAVAVKVQAALGIPEGIAFDVQAVCTGFVYALGVANSFIISGQAKKILVVGAEMMSKILNWEDRTTCVLFGDGAGAIVLEADESGQGTLADRGIFSSHLHANGAQRDLLYVNGGPSSTGTAGHIVMQGKEVFKYAVQYMSDVVKETLAANNIEPEDIDWLVPHQANIRIIESTAKKLGMSMDKVVVTVDQHGNTSAASIPLALDSAVKSGSIKRGDMLLIEGMGGGLTWGAVLARF